MKARGGFLSFVLDKVWGVLATLILVFMVLVAVVGPQPAASLAGTTATVGGQSTGIVFASLPEFFASIKTGQGLVKAPSCASVVDCAKEDKKKEGSS